MTNNVCIAFMYETWKVPHLIHGHSQSNIEVYCEPKGKEKIVDSLTVGNFVTSLVC